MGHSRRSFDEGFKLQVVRMVRDQGLSVVQVCRDMGIGKTAVHRWLKQNEIQVSGRQSINKRLTAEQRKIQQLEAENLKLKQDNDTLIKAAAIFARGI